MKVYFNNELVVEFQGTLEPEMIRPELISLRPAAADATYEVVGQDIYFFKEAKKLG